MSGSFDEDLQCETLIDINMCRVKQLLLLKQDLHPFCIRARISEMDGFLKLIWIGFFFFF